MKILIAEDDAVSRLVLERSLQRTGHEVITTVDGEEAWERFTSEACQFVITDWMMPRLDGLELCRRIRAAQGRDYTYLILLTAKSQKRDMIEGMSAGADDFMAKPFDVGELEVRIRAGERVLNLERSLNERNRQVQAINEQLQRWIQREHLLNQLARTLNESLDLSDVLRSAVTRLQELSDASRAFVMLLSEDRRALDVASEHCGPGLAPIGPRSFMIEGGAWGWAGQANSLLVVHDLENEVERHSNALTTALAQEFEARSLIGAPIVHQGRWLGVIGLHQSGEARRWGEEEASLLRAVAQQLGVAVTNAQLYRQIQEQAVRDGLTGIYNRRHFDQMLPREIERARRFGREVSLVMVDLDHLKQINDQLGHQAGDAAIREVAGVLAGKSRRIDIAARYGGEEFAVVLAETPLAGARAVAETWRAAINQRTVGDGRRLSVSIGVAAFPLQATTGEELIQAADLALYRAKHAGRNRVCVAEPPTPELGAGVKLSG